MTNKGQKETNHFCFLLWEKAIDEFMNYSDNLKPQRLRTCNAVVFETDNFYILRSYNTNVAVIDKRNNNTIDMLRYTYGYSATSAQHISKFMHDYTHDPECYKHKYTWRPIKLK